jgi:hypothetical protein
VEYSKTSVINQVNSREGTHPSNGLRSTAGVPSRN